MESSADARPLSVRRKQLSLISAGISLFEFITTMIIIMKKSVYGSTIIKVIIAGSYHHQALGIQSGRPILFHSCRRLVSARIQEVDSEFIALRYTLSRISWEAVHRTKHGSAA